MTTLDICNPSDILALSCSSCGGDLDDIEVSELIGYTDGLFASRSVDTAAANRDMNSTFASQEDVVGTADTCTQNAIFKVPDDQMKIQRASRQSKSTKNNTKWGIRMFQEWNKQAEGYESNMKTISVDQLAEKLHNFYAEVQLKFFHKRVKRNRETSAKEYHNNTLINVRTAINRHLHYIGRNIDIVRDKKFKPANAMLDRKLASNMRNWRPRQIQNKDLISKEDLEKIDNFLVPSNPSRMRYRVWLILSIHFVNRGMEMHHQLTAKSFEFIIDENGKEYASLTHETVHKNRRNSFNGNKRLYSTNSALCPVKLLKDFINKTDPNAVSLFNLCRKEAIRSPNKEPIWYSDKPMKQNQFYKFMSEISKNAKCTKHYTGRCIRLTSIKAMSDGSFESSGIKGMIY